MWYNMATMKLGTGPALKDVCPWLLDDAARHALILDVTERNSVIEGLPPLREETRQKILADLTAISAPPPAPEK
jgi:hypothetical protein